MDLVPNNWYQSLRSTVDLGLAAYSAPIFVHPQSFDQPPASVMCPVDSTDLSRQIQEFCQLPLELQGRFTPPLLPPPWQTHIDEYTGLLFYWNPETNISQYEHPYQTYASSQPYQPFTRSECSYHPPHYPPSYMTELVSPELLSYTTSLSLPLPLASNSPPDSSFVPDSLAGSTTTSLTTHTAHLLSDANGKFGSNHDTLSNLGLFSFETKCGSGYEAVDRNAGNAHYKASPLMPFTVNDSNPVPTVAPFLVVCETEQQLGVDEVFDEMPKRDILSDNAPPPSFSTANFLPTPHILPSAFTPDSADNCQLTSGDNSKFELGVSFSSNLDSDNKLLNDSVFDGDDDLPTDQGEELTPKLLTFEFGFRTSPTRLPYAPPQPAWDSFTPGLSAEPFLFHEFDKEPHEIKAHQLFDEIRISNSLRYSSSPRFVVNMASIPLELPNFIGKLKSHMYEQQTKRAKHPNELVRAMKIAPQLTALVYGFYKMFELGNAAARIPTASFCKEDSEIDKNLDFGLLHFDTVDLIHMLKKIGGFHNFGDLFGTESTRWTSTLFEASQSLKANGNFAPYSVEEMIVKKSYILDIVRIMEYGDMIKLTCLILKMMQRPTTLRLLLVASLVLEMLTRLQASLGLAVKGVQWSSFVEVDEEKKVVARAQTTPIQLTHSSHGDFLPKGIGTSPTVQLQDYPLLGMPVQPCGLFSHIYLAANLTLYAVIGSHLVLEEPTSIEVLFPKLKVHGLDMAIPIWFIYGPMKLHHLGKSLVEDMVVRLALFDQLFRSCWLVVIWNYEKACPFSASRCGQVHFLSAVIWTLFDLDLFASALEKLSTAFRQVTHLRPDANDNISLALPWIPLVVSDYHFPRFVTLQSPRIDKVVKLFGYIWVTWTAHPTARMLLLGMHCQVEQQLGYFLGVQRVLHSPEVQSQFSCFCELVVHIPELVRFLMPIIGVNQFRGPCINDTSSGLIGQFLVAALWILLPSVGLLMEDTYARSEHLYADWRNSLKTTWNKNRSIELLLCSGCGSQAALSYPSLLPISGSFAILWPYLVVKWGNTKGMLSLSKWYTVNCLARAFDQQNGRAIIIQGMVSLSRAADRLFYEQDAMIVQSDCSAAPGILHNTICQTHISVAKQPVEAFKPHQYEQALSSSKPMHSDLLSMWSIISSFLYLVLCSTITLIYAACHLQQFILLCQYDSGESTRHEDMPLFRGVGMLGLMSSISPSVY